MPPPAFHGTIKLAVLQRMVDAEEGRKIKPNANTANKAVVRNNDVIFVPPNWS